MFMVDQRLSLHMAAWSGLRLHLLPQPRTHGINIVAQPLEDEIFRASWRVLRLLLRPTSTAAIKHGEKVQPGKKPTVQFLASDGGDVVLLPLSSPRSSGMCLGWGVGGHGVAGGAKVVPPLTSPWQSSDIARGSRVAGTLSHRTKGIMETEMRGREQSDLIQSDTGVEWS
jgi:hypothetical protein